jgi:hypothetical protein
MSQGWRRSVPSWRAREARVIRPDLWLLAAGLAGVLLTEVGSSSRMAQVSIRLDQSRASLEQVQARLDFVRAELERRTTRAELVPVAHRLGLAPLDARQVVALPSGYLIADEAPARGSSASLLAWAERAARSLVPEATARSRAID